jgi:hypothetical protein
MNGYEFRRHNQLTAATLVRETVAEEERENASASASASPRWIRLPVNHISLRKERGSRKNYFLFYCQEMCLHFLTFQTINILIFH